MKHVMWSFALVTLLVTSGAVVSAFAQTRETAGLVTEIKVGKGKADVKASSGDWRPVGPLRALRVGDQLRASEDATLMVVLSGGRGMTKVTAKNSPWSVPGVAVDGKAQKAQAVVASSMGFLSAAAQEPPKAVLSTRAGGGPPEILTPRNGLVLGDALVFEWMGSQFSRYMVRITGPTGVAFERKGVVGARFAYPAGSPALEPGVRYTFLVEAVGQPAQQSTFEIVRPARGVEVRAELADLEASLGAGTPANTVTVLTAGALMNAGLLHDARLIVLAALAKDPDEPTLHTILGNLYMQTGLERQAAEAFDEATFLLSRDR